MKRRLIARRMVSMFAASGRCTVLALTSCVASGIAVGLACSGCEDIDWDWELQEWTAPRRPIRPSRPRAPLERESARLPARPSTAPQTRGDREEHTRWTQPKTEDREADRPWTVELPAAEENRAYYHLYLVSGRESLKTPPNSKTIILRHGGSRAVTDLLHRVYPSIGPSGAEDQRFLVYQYEPMWSAASEFVSLLDCPEVAQVPPADPADPVAALKTGVGLLYYLNRPGQPTDFAGFKRVRRLMETAMHSDQASGQVRWGAAMLAGRITAETFSEFVEARKYFELAAGYALPGSVEEMIAAYGVADTYRQEGQRQQAAQLARSLVKKFTAHRTSYLYQQAMELAMPR